MTELLPLIYAYKNIDGRTGPEVEHEILNTHKYKNIKKIKLLSSSYKTRMLFFRLINVEMPTIVGISTFMSRKNFMLI